MRIAWIRIALGRSFARRKEEEFQMKRLIGLATLAVALGTVAVVYGQKDNRTDTNDEVARLLIDMTRQRLQANMTHDPSILEKTLADDYQNMRPTGRFSTKSEEIALVKNNPNSSKCKLLSDQLDDVKARVFGDVAVVYGWETFVAKCTDKVKTGHYFWSDVWLKRSERWQAVAGIEPDPTEVSPLLPPESIPAQSTSADLSANAGMTQAPSTNAIPNTMSSYDFVLGKWTCNGLTPQGKVDYTFTQEISKILNGHWFEFHDVSSPGSGEAFMTYDGKAWRYLSIHDSGAYSIGSSPGWTGNAQTWAGYEYSNGTRRSWGRIILKKVSDREKREDFYAPTKNGGDQFIGSEVCTKID